MDARYYAERRERFVQHYCQLQGFYDVVRTDGSRELLAATTLALDAVWTLMEETDRRVKQEARNETAGIGDPGAFASTYSGQCAHGRALSGPCEACHAIANDPCHARQTAMGQRRLSWAGLDPVRSRIYRETLAGLPGH